VRRARRGRDRRWRCGGRRAAARGGWRRCPCLRRDTPGTPTARASRSRPLRPADADAALNPAAADSVDGAAAAARPRRYEARIAREIPAISPLSGRTSEQRFFFLLWFFSAGASSWTRRERQRGVFVRQPGGVQDSDEWGGAMVRAIILAVASRAKFKRSSWWGGVRVEFF
jgi:hypothetical protein